MSEPIFISLRAHSEFSINNSIIRIPEFAQKAVQLHYPAVALTDEMNVFGLLKFYKACRATGVKPILGADVRVENPDDPSAPFHALLLVMNQQGYLRLGALLTVAYENIHYLNQVFIPQSALEAGNNQGLLCLSGGHLGEINSHWLAGNHHAAKAAAQKYARWFPNAFYLELQRLPERPDWEHGLAGCLTLAEELDLPVVATHPTQFLEESDFRAHDARVCIANGWILGDKKRPQNFYSSQYFISPEEMAARFADLPEALQNSVQIAKRCNVELTLGEHFLPDFPTPNGMNLNEYLTFLSNEGLRERLAISYPDEQEREQKLPEYQQRLDFELEVIIRMGFAGYFLIVQDFINWAKQNGCPVGPGRGSGAGSLVAYSLKITDLDPIKYALLFERFLNPERVSMPDFDIDFCQANRGRVIEYVREKYGSPAVSQIVTFGTLSSKAVIRDVGRVLQLPFGLCDRLSKLVPVVSNKPLGLQEALIQEPEIARILQAEEAEELMTLALKLEDLTRNLGMHAGGVLIAPSKISDFCGVYQADASSSPVSMFDKDDVEQIGLVKFDFLGLRNLTIIEMAVNFIRENTGQIIDINQISLEDQKAYQIYRDANTTAIFQFESVGMKQMLLQANVTNLEEIIAFVSLYRPGPMELIPDFIARMKGASFEYMHPSLEPVLKPTYGIMVYQEQVMQTAQVIAGYSLGGADLLRRAMGKKKPEEMVIQRESFAEGAAKNDVSRAKADEIFDYIEKFAGYGFNKSHAAAYAYVSYQTAWLKAHYPAEFMAATMSSELDNTDQLKVFYDDARSRLNGVSFLPPDINESFYRFIPNKNKEIRYALGAIKGTGEAAVNNIVQVREQGGKFKNLFDFCERVDRHHVNRRALEALIRGGAFDSIEPNRAMLLANVELAMSNADQKNQNANQGSLFDMFEDAMPEVYMVQTPEWTEREKLAEEKQAIGFYLSGHPFAPYEKEVRQFVQTTLGKIQPSDHVRIAGFVISVRTINTKKSGKMVAIELEDLSGKQEVIIRGELLQTLPREIFKADQVLVLECYVRQNPERNNELRVGVKNVCTLNDARSRYARGLSLMMNAKTPIHELLDILKKYQTIDEEAHRVALRFIYENEWAKGELLPASSWRVALSESLLNELNDLLGERAIQLDY